MSLARRLGHGVLRQIVQRGERRFQNGLGDLEGMQRARLKQLLKRVEAARHGSSPAMPVSADWSWSTFGERVPVSCYGDWAQAIESARQGGANRLIASPVTRYQPTSGSTSAIKWIPYTRQFLDELDAAIVPWLADLYRQYSCISKGAHYWSLSWLPTDMRDGGNADLNDDMQLLSFGKRLLAAATQAVPDQVAVAPTSDDAAFATLAYLAADDDLSVLSVWSPTFALTMLQQLAQWREELAECLQHGRWGARAQALDFLVCPRARRQAALLRQWDGVQSGAFFRRLWPNLALVSAWDTAAAQRWAKRLMAILPHAGFQGKGLWATEGVVTFPWQGQHVLAYRSHVYEFEDQDSGRILAPWEVRTDQTVVPLISTGSGLLRYRMGDLLRVSGWHGSVPAFTFLGREDGVDLVGEKLSSATAQGLLDMVAAEFRAQPVSLIGLEQSAPDRGPGYVLLIENSYDDRQLGAVASRAEAWLKEHFHYRLARSLGQLEPLQVAAAPAMRDFYLEQCRLRGMIEGNIKIEPLRRWDGAAPALPLTAPVEEVVA